MIKRFFKWIGYKQASIVTIAEWEAKHKIDARAKELAATREEADKQIQPNQINDKSRS